MLLLYMKELTNYAVHLIQRATIRLLLKRKNNIKKLETA